MVIRGYNLDVGSQRTFLSQSAAAASQSTAAAHEIHNAQWGRQNENDYRSMFKNAKEEIAGKKVKESHSPHPMSERDYRTPKTPQDLRSSFFKMLYELLSGKLSKHKINPHQYIDYINGGRDLYVSGFFGSAFRIDTLQQTQGTSPANAVSFHYEAETVSYQASGVVNTADGKTITVDISMYMSRQFVSFMGISGENINLTDPLVINYGGTAASLTGEKFMFDLTMDGNLDSLAVLGEGSGFLAVDWNGDGIINDGSELFGPSTGCGFSELRKYDTDNNGWIDANDEIFDKLVIWKRDKDGNDTVKTLKELGVGAIFLGDISTEFSFKNETNETLGIMRSTSFFLKYCGGAGTLSHIDLAM